MGTVFPMFSTMCFSLWHFFFCDVGEFHMIRKLLLNNFFRCVCVGGGGGHFVPKHSDATGEIGPKFPTGLEVNL